MSPDLEAVLEDITLRFIDEGWFTAAVVRVERGGRTEIQGAWGDALRGDARRHGARSEAVTPTHLFDIASLTKIFTTTAVLRLVSLGTLDLGTPVVSLLGLARPSLERRLDGVTIERLLAHSSGLPAWFPFYTRRNEPFDVVFEAAVEREPSREAVTYSDLNFMLLGRVIESATRMPLASAMSALVLSPLELDAAGYGARGRPSVATELGNRIEMDMVRERGLVFGGWRDTAVPIQGECDDGNCFYYFDGVAGHAGIFSDARDLCTLGRLYCSNGMARGQRFLEEWLVADARRDHGDGRGLGFQLGDKYPGGGFGHTGFTGTYLYLNDAEKLVVTVLTNRLHVKEPRRVDDYWRAVSSAALEAGRS